MKKFFYLFLTIIMLVSLCGCFGDTKPDNINEDISVKNSNEDVGPNEKEPALEDLFLGKWRDDEGLISFQYKDNKYCGGITTNDLQFAVIKEYTATETELITHMADGRTLSLKYEFQDGFLYLNGFKLSPVS